MQQTISTHELSNLRPQLLRRARRYAANKETAEDIVQDALMRTWDRMQKDPPIQRLEAYVFTSMRRLAPGYARPEEPLDDADQPSAESDVTRRIAAEEVLEAIRQLPEEQAVLLVGVAQGESYGALARLHNVPIGTVMSRIARGRARLRERLGLPQEAPVAALLDRMN